MANPLSFEKQRRGLGSKLWALGLHGIEVDLCLEHEDDEVLMQAARLVRDYDANGEGNWIIACGRCMAEEVREATPRCLARMEALATPAPWLGTQAATRELQIFLRHAVMPHTYPEWAKVYEERHTRRLLVDLARPSLVLVAEYQQALDATPEGYNGVAPLVAVTVVAKDAHDQAEG